jgi:hypothetical protein
MPPRSMKKWTKLFICGSFLALGGLASLRGQIASTHSDASSQPAAARASDEMTKRITDLVNAGKYPEAQALTTGLLVAYPNDERLIKTQALLKQLVPTAAVPSTSGISPSAQPATGADAGQLTGMDKVDYNALIERARQATDQRSRATKVLSTKIPERQQFVLTETSRTNAALANSRGGGD